MARSTFSCSSQLFEYRWNPPTISQNCSAQQVCAAGLPRWLLHGGDSPYMALSGCFTTLTRAPGFVSTSVPRGANSPHGVTAHNHSTAVVPSTHECRSLRWSSQSCGSAWTFSAIQSQNYYSNLTCNNCMDSVHALQVIPLGRHCILSCILTFAMVQDMAP